MRWAHFLHLYQPHDQHPGILEKIVNESYRPLLKGFLRNPKTKITININAVLTEMLYMHGYRDVIEDLKILVELNRVELTGSAKYHAFLPLIPLQEVKRQIQLNYETNAQYFGKCYKPKGFFPPEMGMSPKVIEAVSASGYNWVLADETSVCQGETFAYNSSIYKVKGYDLDIFFREKLPSNILMGALTRTAKSYKEALGKRFDANPDSYIITAMDGETFGHHRPGLEECLFDILASDDFENIFISDIRNYYKKTDYVIPKDSSWASSVKDVKNGNPFVLWFDRENIIHKWEWELTEIAMESVNDSKYSDECYPVLKSEQKDEKDLSDSDKEEDSKKKMWLKSRDLLDKSLNSDPMWWSSAKPWWSIEAIEKGIYSLLGVSRSVPNVKSDLIDKSEELYKKIIFTAHEWQRNGKVDIVAANDSEERKIPLSKKFGATTYYKALLDALYIEEIDANKNREYEKAIKWRDAQYKLERDLDIYSAVSIIDMFRESGNFDRFNDILKEYQKTCRLVSKGQPE